MKVFKTLALHCSIVALIGVAPFATVSIIGVSQGAKYDTSFYGGLVVKDDRLCAVKDKKKIVFLGGSSLSFGLRSDLLGEALGYEVVDYGLYAPLGIKTMAELAQSQIGKDDIVVFAPELSMETYSTNMNRQMFWKCVEKKGGMFHRLSYDDRFDTAIAYPLFASEKMVANVEAKAPYDKASFNTYGDIESELVVRNVMPELYDSGQMVHPHPSMVNKTFVQYLNDYAASMAKKGAKTYFTFSPTNALALEKDDLSAFGTELAKALKFKVLGDVETFVYHQNYFYDTNYHLNYAGTIEHAKALYGLLKQELGIEGSYVFPEVEMPKPLFDPSDPDVDPQVDPDIPPEQPFVIQELADGYYLQKVADSLKEEEIIRVPDEIDGHPIVGINKGAFADFDHLKYVVLPKTVENLANGIFKGCSSLERIYLTNESAPSLVGNAFLDGAPETVRIFILRSARASYSSGYTWINYKSHFSLYNIEDLENLS